MLRGVPVATPCQSACWMEPLISISEQPEEVEATTSTPLAVCGITNVTAAALLEDTCIFTTASSVP